ncbi:hypothetical protein [Actinoplanes sp. CA-252034]|uniref:hypothetical protein n=1 Tax=Actinoplanes sp. CA-252034 TaxID=3239906 RepID=UPI003D9807E6
MRHQLAVVQRQLGGQRVRLAPADRAWLAALHGELLTLGVKIAASTVWSTVWEILHAAGIDPAPDRVSTTWAQFLRSQAEAILAVTPGPRQSRGGVRLEWTGVEAPLFGAARRA